MVMNELVVIKDTAVIFDWNGVEPPTDLSNNNNVRYIDPEERFCALLATTSIKKRNGVIIFRYDFLSCARGKLFSIFSFLHRNELCTDF